MEGLTDHAHLLEGEDGLVLLGGGGGRRWRAARARLPFHHVRLQHRLW